MILTLACAGMFASAAGAELKMDDPSILYSPFNWAVTPTGAKTINPGAYFRVSLESCQWASATTDVVDYCTGNRASNPHHATARWPRPPFWHRCFASLAIGLVQIIFSGQEVALTTSTAALEAPFPQFWSRVDGGPLVQHTLAAGNPSFNISLGPPFSASKKHLLEVRGTIH